jgi:single-stranded DNA-binding protein
MELNGRIKLINDLMTFDSGFRKREFVLTTQEQYPQDIKMEVIQDRVSLLDSVKPGDEVQVFFNVKGREYNGNYYVNLQAWKIESSGAGSQSEPNPPLPDGPPPIGEDDDDLPF